MVGWPMLADAGAQQFDDPYRELTPSQFESLMTLARLRLTLDGGTAVQERADLEKRAAELARDLQHQGLDADWILAQREAVAARRQHAALAINTTLEGEFVELSGYLLVARDTRAGEWVTHLLPDRGVCMHLPPPPPNQTIKLVIDKLPEPLGACIATAVRGRLSANETHYTVPILDDTVSLWSRWRMEVDEAVTAGTFSADKD